MKSVEAMTWEELESALTEYQVNGNGGGMRVKDIQIKHSIEDEISWRREQGWQRFLAVLLNGLNSVPPKHYS